MAIPEMWVNKYRPDTIAGYVFMDTAQKQLIEEWLKEKYIPHLLLSGPAGTGKTTLAKILINGCDVDEYDVKEINASRNNSVDYIRTTVEGFVQTQPFGAFKIVLLDEADYLSPEAQATLRNLMETYASTARFILTCNFPNKIIGPLKSRCQGFHIDKIDKTEFTARVAEVLITEGIDFDLQVLDNFVTATYPDLRKCLNGVQQNCKTGTLVSPNPTAYGDTQDWKITVVELMKNRRYTDARKIMCANVDTYDIDGVFRWMYNTLDLWGDTPEKQDQAILIIRSGIVNNTLVSDPEINLAATFIELTQIA